MLYKYPISNGSTRRVGVGECSCTATRGPSITCCQCTSTSSHEGNILEVMLHREHEPHSSVHDVNHLYGIYLVLVRRMFAHTANSGMEIGTRTMIIF